MLSLMFIMISYLKLLFQLPVPGAEPPELQERGGGGACRHKVNIAMVTVHPAPPTLPTLATPAASLVFPLKRLNNSSSNMLLSLNLGNIGTKMQ